MVNGGVKIGVITDYRRQAHLRLVHRDEKSGGRSAILSSVGSQAPADPLSQGGPAGPPQGHQRVQRRLLAGGNNFPRQAVQKSVSSAERQIKNLVPDGNADSRLFFTVPPPEHAVGEVLNRKVVRRVVGGV